ncbi:serine/threonine kinase [Richelia intracellularis]|nr:serine/threonine kinase [Richelia intracellularis]
MYDAVNAQWVWRKYLPTGVTVNDDLGRVLDNLLKHLPRERYQSVTEVINDLHSPVSSLQSTILAPPQPTQPSQRNVNAAPPKL